jgi:cytochrome b
MARVVRVWDLPVRLFHWLLVVLVTFSFVTGYIGGNALPWHMRSGYCILALVLFRVVWGVVGSRTARFSDFIRAPSHVIGYARSLVKGASMFHAGHNPLGGLMVLLMLVLLLVQATTGLFVDDDAGTRAALADKASDAIVSLFTRIHRINTNVILVCIALHVCAALFYLFVRRDNLIRPMFTGTKLAPDDHVAPALTGPLPALLVLALSAAFVAWLILVYARSS